MEYEYKITTHGRAAMAAGLELGRALPITRVAFGSGKIAEDAELADRHELLRFVSDGSIVTRRHEDDRLYLSLQYANSQHPGVPTFQLWEFMLFCTDPDTGVETDFLYATLGDYPQTVPAYDPDREFPPCVFTFPLTLIVSNELECPVSAPAGLVTWDDMDTVIDTIAIRRLEFAVPATGWAAHSGAYAVRRDIAVPSAKPSMIPFLTVLPEGMAAADACGLAPYAETREGAVRVFARRAPAAEIPASLALAGDASGFCVVGSEETYVLPPATRDALGGVKIGEGVEVTPDGTVSVDGERIAESAAASDESAQAMLDKVFGGQ